MCWTDRLNEVYCMYALAGCAAGYRAWAAVASSQPRPGVNMHVAWFTMCYSADCVAGLLLARHGYVGVVGGAYETRMSIKRAWYGDEKAVRGYATEQTVKGELANFLLPMRS